MSDHPLLQEIDGSTTLDRALLRRLAKAKVPVNDLIETLEANDLDYFYADLLDNGFTPKDLATSRVLLHDIWSELKRFGEQGGQAERDRADRFLKAMAKSGWSIIEAVEEGFTVTDCARAGYGADDCLLADPERSFLEDYARVKVVEKGFGAQLWRQWGHLEAIVKGCRKDGVPAVALQPRAAGIKAQQLLDVGYTASDLYTCNYPAKEALEVLSIRKALKAGYKLEQLAAGGATQEQMAAENVSPDKVVAIFVKRDDDLAADPADARRMLEKLASHYPVKRRKRVKELAKVWSRAEQTGTTFEEVEEKWQELQKLAAKRYRMELAQKKMRKDLDEDTLDVAIVAWRDHIRELERLLRTTADAERKKGIETELADTRKQLTGAEDLRQDLKIAKDEYDKARDDLLRVVDQRRAWLKRQLKMERGVSAKSVVINTLKQYDVAANEAALVINDELARRFYSYDANKPADYEDKTQRWRERIHDVCKHDVTEKLFEKLERMHTDLGEPGKLPEFPEPPSANTNTQEFVDLKIPQDLYQLNARLATWQNLEREYEVEDELLKMMLHTEKRAYKAYGGVVPMKRWMSALQLLGDSVTTASLVPALIRDGAKSAIKRRMEFEPLKKHNATGSRSFGLSLGFSYGEGAKLTAGISVSGALRIDDDRRMRANLTVSISIGGELSPPTVKFIKLTASLGLTVFNRTYAFSDEKHFAYYVAMHLSRIKAARELYDEMPDPRIMARSQKYADLVYSTFLEVIGGGNDKVKAEALAYLAHRPVIKVGAAGSTSLDAGFEDKLTGIQISGEYSYAPKRFEKLHTFLTKGSKSSYVQEYKYGKVQTYGPFEVSATFYLNASFGMTFTKITNDANPDNDGTYLNLSLPGTKYLPGGVSVSAPTDPPPFADHAIAKFKDSSKFSGWNGLVSQMAPSVSSFGLDSSHSVNVVINYIYPEDRKIPVVQYVRLDHSSTKGFDVSLAAETGAGEVGIDIGANIGHSVAMTERLGDNTLTYVATVFNGLIARHNGGEQWQRWMQDHKSGFWRILRHIGQEGSNVRAEAQAMQDLVNDNVDLWKDAGGDKKEVRFLEDVIGEDGTTYGYGSVHRLAPADADMYVERHQAVFNEGSAATFAQEGADRLQFVEHCTQARPGWKRKRFRQVKGGQPYKDGCEMITALLARNNLVTGKQGAYVWKRKRISLSPAAGHMHASIAFDHSTARWYLVKAPLVSGFSVLDVWSNEGLVTTTADDRNVPRHNLRTYYDLGIELSLSVRSHRTDKFMYRGKVRLELRKGHGWEDLHARIRHFLLAVTANPFSTSGFRVSHLKGKNSKPWHHATQLDMLMRLHPELSRRFEPARQAYNAWGDELRRYRKKWFKSIPPEENERLCNDFSDKAEEALSGFVAWTRQDGFEDPMSAILEAIAVPVPAFRHDKAFWQKGPFDRAKPNEALRFADVDELLFRRVDAEGNVDGNGADPGNGGPGAADGAGDADAVGAA